MQITGVRGNAKRSEPGERMTSFPTLPRVDPPNITSSLLGKKGEERKQTKQYNSLLAKCESLVSGCLPLGGGTQQPDRKSPACVAPQSTSGRLPSIRLKPDHTQTTAPIGINKGTTGLGPPGGGAKFCGSARFNSSNEAPGSEGSDDSSEVPDTFPNISGNMGRPCIRSSTLKQGDETPDVRVNLCQRFRTAIDMLNEEEAVSCTDGTESNLTNGDENPFSQPSLANSSCCTTPRKGAPHSPKDGSNPPPAARLKSGGKRVVIRRTPETSRPGTNDCQTCKPSMEELKVGRRVSVTSLRMREAENEELGVPDDMPMDVTVMKHMMLRETQKRQTKKDAPSIYSVTLPSFDETTGKLGDSCSFPSSLPVSEAIEKVLLLERGEQRVKTTSVGITNFLKNFSESHEIIYLFFWYIVAHARRASSERVLIDRYVNLEHVFRTMFPRYMSDLPPLSVLEQIVTRRLRNACTGRNISSERRAETRALVLEDIMAMLSAPEPCSSNIFNIASSFVFGDAEEPNENADTMKSCTDTTHPTLDPLQLNRTDREDDGGKAGATNDTKSPMHDGVKVMTLRLANAIDTFTVAHVEVCELRNLAERCFHRLAMLFGESFERLRSEKDNVFSAYMIIVPHVTYYALVHCFPNDFLAGLLNAVMRVNIYRIFYYWCSGLVATYVRSSGWPTPRQRKGGGQPSFDHQSRGSGADFNGLPPIKRGSRPLESDPNAANSTGPSSPRGGSNDGEQSTAAGSAAEDEQLEFLGDDSFDDVDVEVVNGYHRIVLEFKKYAKHVNFLVHKLEQRTTSMHDRLTEAPKQECPEGNCNKKGGKSVCFTETGADAPLGTNKSVKLGTGVVTESLNDDTKGKTGKKIRQNSLGGQAKHNGNEGNNVLPQIFPNGKSRASVSFSVGAGKQNTSGNNNQSGNDTAVRDSVICSFPLDAALAKVRNYIEAHSAASIAHVPLPPLDDTLEEKPTFTLVEHDENSAVGILPATITTNTRSTRDRTVKVPLPLSSPLFLHYARHRLHPSVLSNLGGVDASKVKTSAQPSPRCFPSGTQFDNRTASPGASKQLTDAFSSGAVTPRYIENGEATKRTPMTLIESSKKPIRMTLIPASETHPRPLQFEGLTKEIRKRHMQFEQNMVCLQEREQQHRQEYNKNTQRGLNLAHQLLSGVFQEAADTDLGRAMKNRKKKSVATPKK